MFVTIRAHLGHERKKNPPGTNPRRILAIRSSCLTSTQPKRDLQLWLDVDQALVCTKGQERDDIGFVAHRAGLEHVRCERTSRVASDGVAFEQVDSSLCGSDSSSVVTSGDCGVPDGSSVLSVALSSRVLGGIIDATDVRDGDSGDDTDDRDHDEHFHEAESRFSGLLEVQFHVFHCLVVLGCWLC